MNCSNISAVIVTKGDVDLSPILESLPFDDIVVWDNAKEHIDQKVYGRYLGIYRAKHDFIYVQDDDCIVPVEDLATPYVGNGVRRELWCNVQRSHSEFYRPLGCTLVGWGAIFPRILANWAFAQYRSVFPVDELFLRECDRVFTGLTPFHEVDLGVDHLPHAHGVDRMGMERRHGDDLAEILRRIASVKASMVSA